MFSAWKKTVCIREIAIRVAVLAFACLLLAACSGAKELEARRGLTPFTVDQNMIIYLPDGWEAQNTGEYGAAVDTLAAEMPIKLPMGTAMFLFGLYDGNWVFVALGLALMGYAVIMSRR